MVPEDYSWLAAMVLLILFELLDQYKVIANASSFKLRRSLGLSPRCYRVGGSVR